MATQNNGDCSMGALLIYLLGMVGAIAISVIAQGGAETEKLWWFGFVYCFLIMGMACTIPFVAYLSISWDRNERTD